MALCFSKRERLYARFIRVIEMKEYICKIATIDEVERKWNYEIRRQKQRKTVLKKLKNDAVYQIKNGQSVKYYGKLNNKIICETTAIFDENIIQNSDELVDDKIVYLCNSVQISGIEVKAIFQNFFDL